MSFGSLFGGSDLALTDGLLLSALGVSIVFIVLAFLMLFITLMSKVLGSASKKSAKAAAEVPAAVSADAEPELAKGSCGSVKLFDVDDRTAAMLMAIVADKMQKPLNELRFISIREIQE